MNGEADAEIAALLEDGSGGGGGGGKGKKAKRRRLEEGDEVTKFGSEEGLDTDDERRSSVVDGLERKGKASKAKEPGVGKGRWTRPSKPEKELRVKAEALAVQTALEGDEESQPGLSLPAAMGMEYSGEMLAQMVNAGQGGLPPGALGAAGGASMAVPAPNQEDPRGVSENEARIRLGLVEDLQKTAWASIVRDIPRVSVDSFFPLLLQAPLCGFERGSIDSFRYTECTKDTIRLPSKTHYAELKLLYGALSDNEL